MRKVAEVATPFEWIGRPMPARVDLADKEAVYAILDDLDVRDSSA